ncbi:M28 family peptidase [Nitratireductor sp. L1-7-SE]|uniref:M28 family peptidase n=1 Tax=Nitratireductor rhodophyticola TaxID=2854036 RepID=A0ABS7R4M8_9HYPH|nr:M28 family peptidase [Nitratireductor rhodophyticola]MBY8915885.1 M28 family peptidase [Nitratireductor rhodophyticola]MBY8921248.1 M28 family peptidase [Nitratireductor rhodophyticola]
MNNLEKQILDSVSLDEPWGLVESFATFKREHPTDVNRGMDEIVSRLRRHGVEVTVHEPSLYLSLPGQARVEADGKTFRAKPPAYSVDASNGVTGELVYVGAYHNAMITDMFEQKVDTTQELADRVRGKIVISEGFASPGLVSQFEEIGAIGVIGINPGVDIHWGICTSIWGTPDLDDLPRKPKIAAAAVNKDDGAALVAIAEKGGSVTLFTEMEEGWFTSKLPEVFIKGTEEPEKYVFLHGHLDSWDVGVGDNATGDASMLEIARVLWENRGSLKRSVRICWWPGHSTGRYAGSTWFSDNFALDLEQNAVSQVNCDSPGCRWATEFINLCRMSETEDFLAEVIGEVAGKTMEGERPHRAGDYSFNNIGISSYLMLSSTMPDVLREEKGYYTVGGCGGNIAWHTENDTLEIADKDILLRDIKVYLLAVLRNANAEILPFDWRATAKEFAQTVAEYQAKAGDRFDLSASKEAVDALASTLDSFYAGIKSGKIDRATANTVIQDLARILVPINFTRVNRFSHDPALTIPPLPSIAAAADLDDFDENTLGFAKTQLVRGQNRLISALRQAQRHVELLAG